MRDLDCERTGSLARQLQRRYACWLAIDLQPEEVLHELFTKLMSPKSIEWQDREHFLIVASRHIREILVQSARRRYASKRSTAGLVEEQEAKDIVSLTREDLIGLEDAVSLLERVAPRAGQVVTLRIFGGLTLDEIAATLGVATVTV